MIKARKEGREEQAGFSLLLIKLVDGPDQSQRASPWRSRD
jgi:hypothetical protein